MLLYHHVGPSVADDPYASLTVSPEKFQRQVRWLARSGYVGIRPADWLAWLRHRTPLPPKPILLSFDDGYADFPHHALPVLRRYGFRAVVFVITRRIVGANAWDGAPLMNSNQIRECSAHGIEFGAHSRTHPDLTSLSGTQLGEEIAGSAEDLSAIIATKVTSFAYPYGFSNEEVRAKVRESFDLAFTCEEGLNGINTDPHRLRRSMVQTGDLLVDVACRVYFGWSPVTALRSRLCLRSRLRNAARYLHGRSG